MDDPLPPDWLQHTDFLRALARRLVVDESRAEDLVQDTMLAALAHPPVESRNLRGWLARVLHRSASHMRRGESRRHLRESRAARDEALPNDSEIVERMETTQHVTSAVLDLPEAYRAVIHLRFYEGLDAREIAHRAGVPVETIRTREKRAVARLRERLDRGAGGSRAAWSSALLPIAGLSTVHSAAPPTLTTATLGTLAVTSTKAVPLAAAFFVVLFIGVAAVGGLFSSRTNISPDPSDSQVTVLPATDGAVDAPVDVPLEDPAERLAVVPVDAPGAPSTPVADPNVVAIDGRLILTSTTGEELASETGRMSVGVTHLGEFEWRRVMVEGGQWHLDVPRGSELRLDQLRFRGLAALVDRPEFVTPDDGEVAVRARLVERPLLHVVDAVTGAELQGVELRSRSSWRGDSEETHPGNHDNVKLVENRVDSPILLPADDSWCVYWARADGYAWGRIKVEHRSGGERTVELVPGATLEVRIGGAEVPTDSYLRLFQLGVGRKLMAVEMSLSGSEPVVVGDLLPGRYLAEVQRHEFADAVTLGRTEVTLEAGAHLAIDIAIDPSSDDVVRVPLAGTLEIAPELAEQGLQLYFTHAPVDGARAQQTRIVGADEIVPIEGAAERFRWDAGDVVPGRYMVYLGPVQHREVIEVDVPGTRDLAIVVGPVAEASIRFVDQDTGEVVIPGEASWSDASLDSFQFSNRSQSLFPDPTTGACTIRTVAGPISVGGFDHRYGRIEARTELGAGLSEVDVPLRRVCSLSVTVWADGARLSFHDDPIEVDLRRTDGEFAYRQKRGAGQEEYFVLVGPGDHELDLDVGDEYEAVTTRQVHVGDREHVDVRFDLVRK